jgi:branched-chain amino acid transport system permease protein
MINFAHGDVFMVGSFLALIALVAMAGFSAPFALAVALIFALTLCGLLGFAIERVAYRPLQRGPRLTPLISAIGVSIALQNGIELLQGARVKPIQPVITGGFRLLTQGTFDAQISWAQIAIMIVTLVVLALVSLLVRRTDLGRAMRAVEQDRMMASLLGIDTSRTISLAFTLGAALAGVAGLMFLVYYGVIDFFIGFTAGIKAFTAAVLGGIGSIEGAVLGGLLIGLIETFWSGYGNAAYKDVAAFAVLILVLLIRPQGLLGRRSAEKV